MQLADFVKDTNPETYAALTNETTQAEGATQVPRSTQRPMPIAANVLDTSNFIFNTKVMTLMFPLPQSAATITVPIRDRGQKAGFKLKPIHDLKFTIVGYPTGRILSTIAKKMSDHQFDSFVWQIEQLIRQTNWNWQVAADKAGNAQYWELSRAYLEEVNSPDGKGKYTRENRRGSIIALIDLPGLEGFYCELEKLVSKAANKSTTLPRPATYITLMVKGANQDGIGISSPDELETYKVKRW